MALVVVAVFLLAVFERFAYAGDVMPGVEVGAVDVGGQSKDDAYTELSALAAQLEREPIRATVGDNEFAADPSLLSVDVDEYQTLRAVRAAARSRNPFEQTAGAILRRFRPDEVELRVTYSEEGLEGILDGWQREIIDGNVEGDLQFEGTTVVEIEPKAGTGILRDEARELLDAELHSTSRDVVELPVGTVEPKISSDEVARTAAAARSLLSGTYTLATDTATLTITPEQLVTAMRTRADDDQLELSIDADALRTALGAELANLETEPVDATFEVTSSNTVNVVPSVNGRQVDMEGVAAAILDGQRDIDAPLREAVPEHDTAWAESLGIKEQVSTFTTNHASGQERVKNIHLGADLINNTIIEPGETFSLNEAVGPRTADRGFVLAPVFYGEFTEDFGGGVSQLATTVFNAAFFGGYDIVTHKPHTIYITRYPMGREATVNYGTVDLQFRNDSSTGILLRTYYTASSIGVTLYGDKEGRIVTEDGRKVLAERPVEDAYFDCPKPEIDPNNVCATLPLGQTKRVEEGHPGIDVEYYRVIERPGQETERERFFWRYRMTPNRILVGAAPPTTLPPETVPPADPSATTVAPSATPPPATP